MPLRCEHCADVFHATKNQLQHMKRHTCSKVCQSARQKVPPVEKTCPHCQKVFYRKAYEIRRIEKDGHQSLYCSRRCSLAANLKVKPPNPAKIRICKRCGTEYKNENGYRSTTKCPACPRGASPSDLLRMTIAEVEASNNPSQGRDKYLRIRGQARNMYDYLTKLPCAHCGYEKHVEVCHIKAISDWPKDTLVSTVNARENIVQLCPTHHWELDNELLTKDQLVQTAGLEPAVQRC